MTSNAYDQLIHSARDEHRLFRNGFGAVSICDQSGDRPETTDDGPLVVRPGAHVEATLHLGRPTFVVDVLCTRDGAASRCFITLGTMRALVRAVDGLVVKTSPEFERMAAFVDFTRAQVAA